MHTLKSIQNNMNKYIKKYNPINEVSDNSESTDNPELYNRVINDVINSVFLGKDKSVILLDYNIPEDELKGSIDSDDYHGHESHEWKFSIDCLYIGNPEMDSEIKSAGLQRFTVMFELNTEFDYSGWSDPGDWDTPGDSGIDLENFETTIGSIYIYDNSIVDFEPEQYAELEKYLSDYSDNDIDSLIKKYNTKFI